MKKNGAVDNFLRFKAAPFLMALVLKFIRRTMRIKFVRGSVMDEMISKKQNFILAFWHYRLLLMPYAYAGNNVYVMVSMHRDGRMTSKLFSKFNVKSIQGSTTRGGSAALRKMVKVTRGGADLGFTPDGPKGPPLKAQAGVIQAARLTGLPILPVSFACSRKWIFRSWDRMQMPKPFSRGVFVYGEPVVIEPKSSKKEIEKYRQRLEDELNRLTLEAEGFFMEDKASSDIKTEPKEE